MNKYRLQHPSSYYAAQFRPEEIRIAPYRAGGPCVLVPGVGFVPDGPSAPPGDVYYLDEQREQGWVMIDRDGLIPFEVRMPCINGAVAKEDVELARKALDRIAELDAEARSLGNHGDEYEEQLDGVEIESSEIALDYGATTMNTDWRIYFKVRGDGTFGPASWGWPDDT